MTLDQKLAVALVLVVAALATRTEPASAQEPAPSKPAAPARDDVARSVADARAERASGRLAEAENLLREALRPSWSSAVGVELGDVLLERAGGLDGKSELMRSLREGTLAEATALFERAAADESARVDATIGVAACQLLADRVGDADATLAALLVKLRTGAGAIEPRRRLSEERIRLLAEHGQSAAAKTLIGEAKEAGEFDAAAVAFEELIVAAAARDDAAIAASAIAAVAAGAGSFEVAYVCWDAIGATKLERLLHLYSRLLEARPHDPALLFYRGVVRESMRDVAGAIEDLKPCLGDARVGEQATLYYGRALVRSNRAEEALVLFEKLAQPNGAWLGEALNGIVDVAVSRARARKLADALALYREVIARDPAHGWARIGEPLCLRNLGEYEQAATAYEAAISVFGDDSRWLPQLLNDYALMLKARGETGRARELFEQALGAGSADGGENLGIIAFREGHDPELAARYFARTLLLDPKRPRVLFYRELCLATHAADSK